MISTAKASAMSPAGCCRDDLRGRLLKERSARRRFRLQAKTTASSITSTSAAARPATTIRFIDSPAN